MKNEKNGRTVRVAVNDRGLREVDDPPRHERAAAAEIDSVADGVVPVKLTVVTVGDNSRRRASPNDDDRPGTAWAVQAGAFGDEEKAKRLRKRLAERYPTPWLEEASGLKRVKFGPFRSKAEAEAARDSLAGLGLAGIVVPYR